MTFTAVDCARPDAPARFRDALAATGCALLLAHPLEAGVVERVYEEWLAFFDTDAKHRYDAGPDRPDGYFPPPPESGGFTGDRKEFFHVYPRGRYPAEVSGTARHYLRDALEFARTLLGWLDREKPTHGATATVLRVQRYLPARDGEPADATRALAHTDINLLTLMPAPSAPGLQIRHDGGWRDVLAPPGSLLVQAGEMLQLASRGRFPAALHRVVHRTGPAARTSRMSLPLFVHPADDTELVPGRTAGAFRAERLAEMSARGWKAVAGGPRQREAA
ncbi:2OG-Fe(II) oxygenase family protein [Streptomyces avermitilis]|uniref:2OG-Fe(II) oxygenase family protein n=1 Tax=Streptomyces avermitilis TaxID=33903 RepID=UPI0033A4C23E